MTQIKNERDRSNEPQVKQTLKENDGAFCPKCKLLYTEKVKKCEKCNSITEPAKWVSRFLVERIAFIITLAIVSVAVVPFFTNDIEIISLVPFLTAIILFSAYHTANYFLGIGGGFKENFKSDEVPQRAYQKFSVSRYFSEFFRLVGILVALIIFVGIIMLIRWIMELAD